MDQLTTMQSAFVEEYLANGGNAKAAALKAGYAESVAQHAGREILQSASVKNAVDECLRDLRDRAMVKLAANLDSVLDELISMGLSDSTPATAKARALVEILDRGGILAGASRLTFSWERSHDNGLDDFLRSVNGSYEDESVEEALSDQA